MLVMKYAVEIGSRCKYSVDLIESTVASIIQLEYIEDVSN